MNKQLRKEKKIERKKQIPTFHLIFFVHLRLLYQSDIGSDQMATGSSRSLFPLPILAGNLLCLPRKKKGTSFFAEYFFMRFFFSV